jgi:hypothetical protein
MADLAAASLNPQTAIAWIKLPNQMIPPLGSTYWPNRPKIAMFGLVVVLNASFLNASFIYRP